MKELLLQGGGVFRGSQGGRHYLEGASTPEITPKQRDKYQQSHRVKEAGLYLLHLSLLLMGWGSTFDDLGRLSF